MHLLFGFWLMLSAHAQVDLNQSFDASPHEESLWQTFRPLDSRFPRMNLFPYEECQNESNQSILIREGGVFEQKCLPDTLYSWDSLIKVQELKNSIGRGISWAPYLKTLFMTRSPLASHGYGQLPIRIKLKKGVHWKESLWGCDQENNQAESDSVQRKPEYKNTVYFRSNSNFFDFAICSSDVIESWSYGLEESYDELLKEYFFTERYPELSESLFDRYARNVQLGNPFTDLLIDQLDFSFETFREKIPLIHAITTNKKGELFCQPTRRNSDCSQKEHFRTVTPIYYNEE
jgi:hypothetical protein